MTTVSTRKKGLKFRIYPNKEQEVLLAKTFGSCRFVYNKLLSDSIEEYKLFKEDPLKYTKPEISINEFSRRLVILRHSEETLWLSEVSFVPVQQASRHLVSAFSIFFKKNKGYPKFKSKRNEQSATFTVCGYRLKEDKLWLGRFNSGIKVKWSRDLPDEPRTCTVSKNASGKYYASFICEYTPNRANGTGTIGIDVGITDLAVMSNGEFIKNPKYYIKYQERLAKCQRKLFKKQKGSKNRNKARIKVASIHEKIKNSRFDHLHKLSSRIIRENQAIAIESLMVKNMVKNRKLSKHISDAGWGLFRDQLKYKIMETKEGKLVLADPYFPSTQICNSCLKRPKNKIKLGVTKWTCMACNTTHQRDLNAALNLETYLKALLKNWIPDTKILLANGYKTLG